MLRDVSASAVPVVASWEENCPSEDPSDQSRIAPPCLDSSRSGSCIANFSAFAAFAHMSDQYLVQRIWPFRDSSADPTLNRPKIATTFGSCPGFAVDGAAAGGPGRKAHRQWLQPRPTAFGFCFIGRQAVLAARMWPRIQPTPNTGDSDALDTARPLRDNCPAQGVSGMSLYGIHHDRSRRMAAEVR